MSWPQPRFAADPVTDRARRNLLQKLKRDTKNRQLAELASELLAGNITPRSVLESDLYGEALAPVTQHLAAWYSSLSEQEKAEHATQGEEALRQLADDQTSTPNPASRAHRAPATDEDEDFSDRNWIDG